MKKEVQHPLNVLRKRLPLLLAAILLLSAASGFLSAAAVSAGDDAGFGSVTGNTSRTVAEGLTYESTSVAGTVGGNQQLHTLTFNPKTSDFMPIVYSQYTGYGATTLNSAKRAESVGYDVKGGVNAAFFGFTGKSANTYGGVNICDGKILQGNNAHGEAWELIFNSDGSSALVRSRVTYSLVAQHGAWNAPLTYINICPEINSQGENTTGTGIYYYDTFCGTKTDTKKAGVEILFEKQNHTELTVGGTLIGKVAEVRANTSTGNPVGATQFVLYASDDSPYASSLRKFAVGDVVEITAEETVVSSKTAMETCSSAVVTYGYHIVENGTNVTANDGLGDAFNKERAQRSAIGIKADGTLVIVASPGRTTANTGLTVYELADYMISQGCVTAVNLDGGGSTQMVVENESGDLVSAVSTTRAVANSILIVSRPAIDPEIAGTLQTLIATATALANNTSDGNKDALKAALTHANAVFTEKTSMPGDYSKAIMRLQEALDTKAPLRELLKKTAGISFTAYSEYVLEHLRAAHAEAFKVYTKDNAAQSEIDQVYAELLKWYNATGSYKEGGKTYPQLTNEGNFYLSYFNRKIETDDCNLFTSGESIEAAAANLTYSAAILLRKNEKGQYIVEKIVNGAAAGGSGTYVPEKLGFTVVPEGCIVIGAHGKSNVPVRFAAEIGLALVPHGFDIETKTIGVGAYFSFEAPAPVGMIGDVNCNGRLDALDYAYLKRHILETYKLTEEGLALADVDGNGKINGLDYAFLKRAFLGTYKIPER
ncbi:MAG: phosphodiester glycosidase family protein [Oscillospiraceae bacterium]|nr:phosphodiester glycosidase family protein [Oscillospiraceae bacterium]